MLQKASVSDILAAEAQHGRTSRVVLIIVGAVIAVVLAIGAWIWWSSTTRSSLADLSTEIVSRSDIHTTLVATGTLQAVHQVAVTGQTAGKIKSVYVTYNQAVTKGQPLAQLDLATLEARLSRAIAMVAVQEASVTVANATLADAQANLRRLSALPTGREVTVKDMEQARTAADRAEASRQMSVAQLEAAKADLSGAQNDLAQGTINSPMDGMVLDVAVEAGEWISSTSLGQPLFTIASDTKVLDLAMDIDEADVATIKEGAKVSFTVEAAPGTALAGTLRQIRSAPSVVDGVVSYKGMVAVDNASMKLRPGMTATAVIDVADAIGVISVPNAALRYSPADAGVAGAPAEVLAGDHVWVLEQGTERPVAVTVGLTDGQRTEIMSGLKEGDVVIISGGAK